MKMIELWPRLVLGPYIRKRFGNLRAQVLLRRPPRHPGEEAVLPHDGEAQLEPEPDRPAVEPREEREACEPAPLALRVGAVAARQHPVGAALEDRQVPHPGRDLRDQLDGARRVADHPHALAREVGAVVEARRVEARAAEAVEPRDGRDGGPVQLADRAHQHVGDDLLAAGRAQAPDPGPRVEPGAGDLRAEAEVADEVVLPRAVLHVVADLFLGGPQSRPVRLLLEREAVEGGRDVAGGARVGVVAPGAAQAVRLLEDRERVDAGLLQLDAEAEPREARADDRDASLCHSGQDTPAAARPTMARSAPRRTLTRRLQAGGSGPACAAFSTAAASCAGSNGFTTCAW